MERREIILRKDLISWLGSSLRVDDGEGGVDMIEPRFRERWEWIKSLIPDSETLEVEIYCSEQRENDFDEQKERIFNVPYMKLIDNFILITHTGEIQSVKVWEIKENVVIEEIDADNIEGLWVWKRKDK